MCQYIRQCCAYGKHTAVRVHVSLDGHVRSSSNVTNACINSEACMMDLTWALVRMPPLKLFGVDLFLSEKQRVPGWSGFNAVVLSCVPVLTNIGYCPMIDGSPTEFWPRSAIVQCTFFLNVYTVLNSIGEPSISLKNGPVLWRGLSCYRQWCLHIVIIVSCNLFKHTSGNI